MMKTSSILAFITTETCCSLSFVGFLIELLCSIMSASVENIHFGVKMGCEEKVRELLNEGVDPDEPDWTDSSGQPPLILAAQKGFANIIQLLLAAKCDVNVRNSLGETALHVVVQRKYFNADIAELLLEHSELNPNIQDNLYGYAPLHVLVKAMVSTDTNICDKTTNGLLSVEDALKIMSVLAVAGDVNIRSHRGDTPLHKAVSGIREQPKLVQLLLECGADCDIQNECGETALVTAIIVGHHRSAELLLAEGANPNISDKYNQTGLHHAALRNKAKLVSLLLQYECEANKRDLNGNTALHLAAQKGYVEVVRLLLSNPGVDANILDINGKSALLKAAEGGFLEVVKLFINSMQLYDDEDDAIDVTTLSSCRKDVALEVISNGYVQKWHPEICRLIKCAINSVSCTADL